MAFPICLLNENVGKTFVDQQLQTQCLLTAESPSVKMQCIGGRFLHPTSTSLVWMEECVHCLLLCPMAQKKKKKKVKLLFDNWLLSIYSQLKITFFLGSKKAKYIFFNPSKTANMKCFPRNMGMLVVFIKCFVLHENAKKLKISCKGVHYFLER